MAPRAREGKKEKTRPRRPLLFFFLFLFLLVPLLLFLLLLLFPRLEEKNLFFSFSFFSLSLSYTRLCRDAPFWPSFFRILSLADRVEVARLVPGSPLDVASERPLDRLPAHFLPSAQHVVERRPHVRARRRDAVGGPRVVKLPVVEEPAAGVEHVELGSAGRPELFRDFLRLVEEVTEAGGGVPEFLGVVPHRSGTVLGVRLCRVGADSHNFDKFRRILPSEGDEGVFQEDDEGAVVAFVNETFFFGGGA